ncbi:MAG: FMN-binding protein [Spirochaetales bacterium]|nr:FMN-binding protein [Spirochaetales bacterium]
MKKKTPPALRAALFLFVLTTVCTFFLAGGNALYEGELAKRDESLRKEIVRAFGGSFTDDTFGAVFDRTVERKEFPSEKATVYLFKGAPRQAAVRMRGPGLWNEIDLLVFFDLDSNSIKSVRVIFQAETAGLGSRIEEPGFLNQFRNISIDRPLRIVRQRTGAPDEVDAITGATSSSQAVGAIVNRAAALAARGEEGR